LIIFIGNFNDFNLYKMKIYPIETGNFKLDGGAMFGVVPKTIWQKTNPADDNNLIDMSMRSMLIEDGDRLILVDTGLGAKQSNKFYSYYYLFGDFSLNSSLAKHGFHRDDITDVFLTHLHFDHCGGAIEWNTDRTILQPVFKNAKFWSNEQHWKWATEPNPREKASFFKENINPIKESGQLNFIDSNFKEQIGFDVLFVDGHTEKQMLPMLTYQGKTVVFVADLLPTIGHIPLAYVVGYDTRPLLTLKEKELFLNEAADNEYYLFLEHDAYNELCTVKRTEKGVRLKNTHKFTDIFN
jgi:glyoxylase-like metal-dependent hydrolase (beta-lactamase superfamily II)